MVGARQKDKAERSKQAEVIQIKDTKDLWDNKHKLAMKKLNERD